MLEKIGENDAIKNGTSHRTNIPNTPPPPGSYLEDSIADRESVLYVNILYFQMILTIIRHGEYGEISSMNQYAVQRMQSFSHNIVKFT